MNVKLFLVVMATAFVCIASKFGAQSHYDDEVSFHFEAGRGG